MEKVKNKCDEPLIKLRRLYSKDETVAALSRKLSEVEIELGKAISYIHELEYERHQKSLKNGGQIWFEKYNKIKERFDKLQSELNDNSIYAKLKSRNAKLNAIIKKLRKENSSYSI